ncbi:YciI family protein [Cellulomonas sp. ICMP 17802]|uniref:YciI family protein n=1 Tax=Cellulomonas sp. ICMP 17802 TaxID=3239199 RepID=UPI00351B5D25
MSDTWMVLLYGDEDFWQNATPEITERVMAEHRGYAAACAEQGHKILGGEELGFSKNAVTVQRTDEGTLTVTDGPYVELAEQVGGYYVIETDDVQGLARLTGEHLLLSDGGGAELRPVVVHES